MFLRQLTKEQATAFYQLAVHLVSIDENIDHNEKLMLEMVLLELNIAVPDIDVPFSMRHHAQKFTTKLSQRICFLELCCLMAADELLHEKEDAFLVELQNIFKMDSDYYRRCMSYATTLVMLIKTGQRLVEV
jgi:hypothetical protein